MSFVHRAINAFSLAFRWQDIGLMAILLVALNVLDAAFTLYAVDVLGFNELNPLAAGLPIWLSALKFGVCFVPSVCAYVLEKLKMKGYLLLPFVSSTILMVFYAFVIGFNIRNILGA